jgi:integrase
MATIEKRTTSDGTSYRAKIRLRGFPSQSATFTRLTDARLWVQQTEAAIREGRYFKTSQSKKRTLADALARYETEILKPKGKKAVNQRIHLRWWNDRLGAYTLADISTALIVEQRSKLMRGEDNATGQSISNSTANRYATSLSHVFTVAMNEWEWVESNPVSRLKKLKEPRGRVRFLSDEERQALLEACEASDNKLLYTVVVLALSTGARKMELLALRWKDVDLKRQVITLHETKNGERRVLPLQGRALSLMTAHSKVRSLRSDYVFASDKKNQPTDMRTSWVTALARAGIEDFRFHDLRHSAASYLAMNGASLAEIAEVLGHKTLAMVKRYAHLSEAHTSKVVARMNEKIFGV